MMPRIIGIILVAIGVVINFSYKPILEKIIRVKEITDIEIIKVKSVALMFVIAGAIIVFAMG